MAELAARLGSPDTFDRRGDVIHMTTFANGWGGWQRLGSTGAAHNICAYWGEYGNLHAWLTTGPNASDNVILRNTLFFPALGGQGYEASFVAVSGLRTFQLGAAVFTGSTLLDYRVQYIHTTGNLEILDADGYFHTLATPGIMREGYGTYTVMKMVFNTLTGKYARVLINGSTYLADNYSAYATSSSTRKGVDYYLWVITDIAAAIDVAVGHIIITQNEP
jgi:hypothetical protein